jgi:hypothetical protein
LNNIKELFKHKFLVTVSFFGILIFYLWQPISDFFEGHFHQNVLLQIDTETINAEKGNQILVVHIKPINRGYVPVEIGDIGHPGSFTLEIRKVNSIKKNNWVEYNNLPIISKFNILNNYKDGYILEPGAVFDEVEAIELPQGNYWVKAVFSFGKDYFVDSSELVEITTNKK